MISVCYNFEDGVQGITPQIVLRGVLSVVFERSRNTVSRLYHISLDHDFGSC